jgi:hypothetical protein
VFECRKRRTKGDLGLLQQNNMPGSRSSNNEAEHKSPRESGDDSEDESEILEESPCGRWLKRKEEVSDQFEKFP